MGCRWVCLFCRVCVVLTDGTDVVVWWGCWGYICVPSFWFMMTGYRKWFFILASPRCTITCTTCSNWTSLSEVPLLVLCPSDAWLIGWHIWRQGSMQGIEIVISGKLDAALHTMAMVYWEFLSVHISGSKCSSKSLGKLSYRLAFRAFQILFYFQCVMSPFDWKGTLGLRILCLGVIVSLLDVSIHTAFYERRSLWWASTVDGCNGVSAVSHPDSILASTSAYGCASLRDSQILKRFLGSPHAQDDA